MDAQYRKALIHGNMRLKSMALLALFFKTMQSASEYISQLIEQKAEKCDCGMSTALSCGNCYDDLMQKTQK